MWDPFSIEIPRRYNKDFVEILPRWYDKGNNTFMETPNFTIVQSYCVISVTFFDDKMAQESLQWDLLLLQSHQKTKTWKQRNENFFLYF